MSKTPSGQFGTLDGMRGVGAMLLLSGWAHLRDPADNPVAEASEGRARKGTESGDPPPGDSR